MAEAKRLKPLLEGENDRLKKLLVEAILDNEALKIVVREKAKLTSRREVGTLRSKNIDL